ncbi:MAG: FtsX-like permease family protein [Gemmatimonadetes bacterium]|nr:FtsX-like permease family protein [Gemmatimonadota bacterium]
MVETLATVPGVMAVGAATHLPRQEPETVPVRVADEGSGALPGGARRVAVLPGFFEVLGARATAGRLLDDADLEPGAAPVAVVNEPFVQAFLGGRNAVGRRLIVSDRTVEIVGVVPDLGMSLGDPRMAAGLYVPLEEGPFQLVVRGPRPRMLEGRSRAALATLDPTLAPGDFTLLEQAAEENVAFLKGMSLAMLGVGGVALLLSLVGIYALLSWSVTRRTREIGVRVALGARPGRILREILGGAAVQLGAGAAVGTGLGSLLRAGRDLFTFRLPDPGPYTFPGVVALLLLAGGTAAWVPCRRALRVRPAHALRQE